MCGNRRLGREAQYVVRIHICILSEVDEFSRNYWTLAFNFDSLVRFIGRQPCLYFQNVSPQRVG